MSKLTKYPKLQNTQSYKMSRDKKCPKLQNVKPSRIKKCLKFSKNVKIIKCLITT